MHHQRDPVEEGLVVAPAVPALPGWQGGADLDEHVSRVVNRRGRTETLFARLAEVKIDAVAALVADAEDALVAAIANNAVVHVLVVVAAWQRRRRRRGRGNVAALRSIEEGLEHFSDVVDLANKGIGIKIDRGLGLGLGQLFLWLRERRGRSHRGQRQDKITERSGQRLVAVLMVAVVGDVAPFVVVDASKNLGSVEKLLQVGRVLELAAADARSAGHARVHDRILFRGKKPDLRNTIFTQPLFIPSST